MKHGGILVLMALTFSLAVPAAQVDAQERPRYGDDVYQPQVGQHGKDVIWVPTPDSLVTRMLQAAKTTDKDIVFDLGAGDGKIAIAAAKEFGATAFGIEYDKDMAALGKRNAERAGVGKKVTIIEGDIFKEDFSKATVVTMYLLPSLNIQLRPALLKMKPGTRVVSHAWDMNEWEADESFQADGRTGHLWIIPANVAGRWTLSDDDRKWRATLDLTQKYQRIGGTLTLTGKTQPVLGAYINGEKIGFTFVDTDGSVRNIRALINGDTLTGSSPYDHDPISITGRRP